MEFANASYLWGLLGLLLPIAIHLWSRKKVVTIKVGSTKLLQASEPKQTSSIKLNEWWLLALRLLTVFLLVLILSEPNMATTQENVAISYLIEPSLLTDDRMATILDTLPEGSVRLLEDGFPEWDGKAVTALHTPSYWQLAQEMHRIAADSIVVFSSGRATGVRGRRPSILANTKWIVLEPMQPIETALAAIQKENYVAVVTLRSDANTLSFTKDSLSGNSERLEISLNKDSVVLKSSAGKNKIALDQNSPIRVAVVYDDSLKLQYQYVKAAYSAISKFLDRPIEIAVLEELNRLNTMSFNTVVSFSTDVITEDLKVTLLILKPDALAKDLIEKGPTQNIFYLTQLLDSENIVREKLPEQLLKLLNRHETLAISIQANDLRVLAESELQPLRSTGEGMATKASVLNITPWLWLFLILVIVVERILAKVRKQ